MAELTQVTVFTCQQTLTHQSSNQARCRTTLLIKSKMLTTTPDCNPPTEPEQGNLHGFLPSFNWPDYVSKLFTLW